MINISAILLGAGESKRMGINKLFLPWGGLTILEHCINNLIYSEVNEVIVVINPLMSEIEKRLKNPKIKVVVNHNYKGGMSTSIRRGIQAVSPNSCGILIALGDQPFIKKRTINALIHAFRQGKRGIIVPSFQKRKGNPVIFHRKYEKELLKLRGDFGGRVIIERHPDDVWRISLKSRSIVTDIDTWRDYKEGLISLYYRDTKG